MQPSVPHPPVPPTTGQPSPYPPGLYGIYPGAPNPYGAYPPGYPGPYGGYPGPYGGYPVPPRPPAVGLPRPTAVAPVADSPFAVALVEVRPTASGPAAASLVAGIASILVAPVVGFFAVVGARGGWGAPVAGAFALLATVLCAAAVGLSRAGRRRIRASVAWGPTVGRGVAIAGQVCGLVGFGITALIMVFAVPT